MPIVVHYWADLQSVRGLRCYGNITRTRNVSEYTCLYSLYAEFVHTVDCDVQRFVKMSTRSSWSDPSDERAWTREYSRQQQRHTVPGEVVVYVDHHPAPVPRQPAACTDLQLPDPQMTSRPEEESSVDASGLGDDEDLLQEAVRPVYDSVSTTPAADATNTQLITADLVQVKLPPIISSDADLAHPASVSRDTAAAGDHQVDEMEGEGIVESLELIVDSPQQAYNSVHGLNVTSRKTVQE